MWVDLRDWTCERVCGGSPSSGGKPEGRQPLGAESNPWPTAHKKQHPISYSCNEMNPVNLNELGRDPQPPDGTPALANTLISAQ